MLTYQVVGDLVGMPPIALTQPLGLIMAYCAKYDLPLLTVLLVSQESGKPGKGLTTTIDIDKDREIVFNFNWYRRFPLDTSDFEMDF